MYYVTFLPLLPLGNSKAFADVLIVNGPGTCFVLCLAVYINKVDLIHERINFELTILTVLWFTSTQADLCRVIRTR